MNVLDLLQCLLRADTWAGVFGLWDAHATAKVAEARISRPVEGKLLWTIVLES